MIDLKNIPWTEKHRVKNFEDIKGQDLAIEKVRYFLDTFPKKRGLILHGPPGTGKTSLAYAIASESDAEIIELNASDFRNKDKINSILGPASLQKSLFNTAKILLVDEVDGVSTFKDRGGIAQIIEIIKTSAYPVIITANDIWQQKFNTLRKESIVVQVKELDYKVMLGILMEVCLKENFRMSQDVLKSIALKARGDIRAAINDLQLLSRTGSPELVQSFGTRDKEQSIFTALQYVFKKSSIDSDMIRVFDEVNMPLDEIFLWVEENIPLEYKGEELAKAFDALSLADVYRGRIRRQRHWRFMVYEYFLLGAGIASVKKSNRGGWTSYKKPSRILKIWLQNQRSAKKKSICAKYAKHVHISTRTAMKDFMVLRMILQNQTIRQQLRLSSEEIEYLDKPMTA